MKKIVVFILTAVCVVCMAIGISACGSAETKAWQRGAIIVTEDTYNSYSSYLGSNCFENTTDDKDAVLLFDNESVTELEMDTQYYFIAGVNAITEDGTAVTHLYAVFELQLRNLYTSTLLSKDSMSIVSGTEYIGGKKSTINFTWSSTKGYTYVIDSDSFSSDSEAWYCIVVCFKVSAEGKLTIDALSSGSEKTANVISVSKTLTRTATIYYEDKVNINSLSVNYLSYSGYNSGDFSDSNLTTSPTFNVGGVVYAVIDLELQSEYDADTDKVTVRLEVSPSDSMVARIIDANTSTISNETTEDNVSIASATYSLPEKSGDTRSERLIIQLSSYLTGSAKIVLRFYADQVSFTGKNTYSKSITIAGASDDNSGATDIQYRLSSDRTCYTVVNIGSKLTDVEIPDTYGDLPVTGIEESAASGCAVRTLTIGDNVTSIGASAFKDCKSLYSLTLGSGVTSIGNSAFENCYSLVQIYNKSNFKLTAGATTYGNIAYNALNIYTPSSGEDRIFNNIGRVCIYDSSNTCYLVSYIGGETSPTIMGIPSDGSVGDIVIHQYAFCNTSCTSVTLASSVVKIEGYAFYGSSLTSITIGSGVTSLESYSLSCDTLTSITIPVNVIKIDSYAFSGCTSLKSVTFANTSGWYVYQSATSSVTTRIDVTNPSTNATNFTNTYVSYVWRRG